MTKRRAPVPVLGRWALALWFAAGASVGVARAADQVVLQLNWDHQFQFAGYYAAKWHGFYKQEGLEVEIRSAFTPKRKYLQATREVAEGRATFGTGAIEVLQAWGQGAPLRILATIFQRSPIRFYALERSNIRSPADLAGRRVATRGPSNGAFIELMNVLQQENIDPDQLHFVPIRSGLGLRDLARGHADVATGFSISSGWVAARLGIRVTTINPASYGIDFYGSALFSRAEITGSQPDLVNRFVRASQKGWEYALEHGDAIADRIATELPRTLPLKDPKGFNRFQVKPVRYLSGYPLVSIGHTNPGRWRKMYESLLDAKLATRPFKEAALIFDPLRQEKTAHEHLIQIVTAILVVVAVGTLLLFAWMHLLRVKVDKAVTAMRFTESKNRVILDHASDAILVVDDTTGNILDANNEMQRVSGRRREDLIGNPQSTVYEVTDHSDRAEDEPQRHPGRAHATIKGPVGRTTPVEVSSARYRDDRQAVVIHIFRDVSTRIAYEAELRRSRERYRAIMDATMDGILALDPEGRIQTVNPAARTIFGFSAWEMMGKYFTTLLAASVREDFETRLVAYRQDRDLSILAQGQITIGKRRDETTFPMEIGIAEFMVAETRNLIVTVRDITAQQATQAQLIQAQKMDAVGQLTGGVAHDFNNILGAILGNLELVERNADMADDDRPLVDAAIRATRRGAELTRRLLAFSRAQVLEPQSIDVNDQVRELTQLLERTLGKTIEIEARMAEDLKPILVDPTQLETALLNLVVNARDAMPEGGSVVIATNEVAVGPEGIDLGEEVAPGRYVRIAVSDQGAGMTDAVRVKAFDPFFTTKQIGKGTGLGLSMVYGFVKQSGGHVEITSTVGRGTTVTLYLPEMPPSGPDATQSVTPTEELPGTGETVLLVEDDDAMRSMIARQLAGLGYTAQPVTDGAEAMAVLKKDPAIEILLTNVILPGGMSGLDLARSARHTRPSVRILFMSGYVSAAAEHDSIREAGDQLIAKPFGIQDLSHALNRCRTATPLSATSMD